MKRKVLIVSAHFPPSNQVSVHRSRLIANHLSDYGWEPTVLTLKPKYYEEPLDISLLQLVAPQVRVVKTSGLSASFTRQMGIGDIGLRGLPSLLIKGCQLILDEKIQLVFITIPSNYQALLGPMFRWITGVPYIIDYQDPWINESKHDEPRFSKAWWTQLMAGILEPWVLKSASGISGMTESYFKGALLRNHHAKVLPTHSFQMGFSKRDHQIAEQIKMSREDVGFNVKGRHFVYAGALLPKGHETMRYFLRALAIWNQRSHEDEQIHFHCYGTGIRVMGVLNAKIDEMACEENAGLWVHEHPERRPFLEILKILSLSDGVVIAGSTESHYSPSKLFQGVLSKKPVIAWLHRKSEAASLLALADVGVMIPIDDEVNGEQMVGDCLEAFKGYARIRHGGDLCELFKSYESESICRDAARFFDKVEKSFQRVHS